VSFSPDVVAAVLHHMNNDHADDCAVICRGLGGQREATAAVMSGLDSEAAYFEATVNGEVVPVRIPFRQTLTERAQIRVEVTQMYYDACARLGLPSRTH
jgi:putative heme iron utilization protein